MRAFVTGGNGFLGIHLVRLLLANSWTVSVLVRKTSDLSLLAGLDVELVEGDLLDPETWEGHFWFPTYTASPESPWPRCTWAAVA